MDLHDGPAKLKCCCIKLKSAYCIALAALVVDLTFCKPDATIQDGTAQEFRLCGQRLIGRCAGHETSICRMLHGNGVRSWMLRSQKPDASPQKLSSRTRTAAASPTILDGPAKYVAAKDKQEYGRFLDQTSLERRLRYQNTAIQITKKAIPPAIPTFLNALNKYAIDTSRAITRIINCFGSLPNCMSVFESSRPPWCK